jgi:hypothetical protein
MKTTSPLLLVLLAGCTSALAQGQLNFGNRVPVAGIDAPFGYPMCLGGEQFPPPAEWVRLSGAKGWVAQLYVAPREAGGPGTFFPVGTPVPFRDGERAGQ